MPIDNLATILWVAAAERGRKGAPRRAVWEKAGSPERMFSGGQLSMVAGTGFEPVTFRL